MYNLNLNVYVHCHLQSLGGAKVFPILHIVGYRM